MKILFIISMILFVIATTISSKTLKMLIYLIIILKDLIIF